MKRIISLVLVFISLTSYTVFGDNDYDTITLQIGSTAIDVNGNISYSGAPFIENDIIFLPLRAVVTGFGAELYFDSGEISVEYGEKTAELFIEQTEYFINEDQKFFQAAPKMIDGTTMISADFLSEIFECDIGYNNDSGVIKITLLDDGALTDLSFLTGEISSSKIGNSDFKFKINVPKGSEVKDLSNNGSYISISNNQRRLYLTIIVEYNGEEKTLKDIKKTVEKENAISGFELLNLQDDYLEVVHSISYYYSSLSYQKTMIENGNIYTLLINSYDHTSLEKFQEDEYLQSIINSFTLDYDGEEDGIKDYSQSVDGLIKYEKKINLTQNMFEDADFAPVWEFDIPYNFEMLSYEYYDSISASWGLYPDKMASVQIMPLDEEISFEEFAGFLKTDLEDTYNPELFTFIDDELDEDKYTINYQLTKGETLYNTKRITCFKDGIAYIIDVMYSNEEDETVMNEIVNSFNITLKKTKELKDKLKEAAKLEKPLSEADEIFNYESNFFKFNVPGYWVEINSQYSQGDIINLYHPSKHLYVKIETVKNTSINKNFEDSEKFKLLYDVQDKMNDENRSYGLLKKEKTEHTDKYIYRYAPSKYETGGDDIFYVINNGDYSYCIEYEVPDLYANEKNLEVFKNIIESFEPINKD